MYNRYVPGHNGTYEKFIVPEHKHDTPDEAVQCTQETTCDRPEIAKQQRRPEQSRQSGLDLGDLLLLCIMILLLIDSDGDDTFPLLIMAAAFLVQQ